jgi:heat shock protein HtpX
MRYILLPLLTLVGVVLTAVMWVNLFQLQTVLVSTGISLSEWLVIDILWTIGSGVFSWALSRDIAIWSTDTDLLDSDEADHPLMQTVKALAQELKLKDMPQVGIYPSPEVNLFSSGPLPSRSVISVSQGFLRLNEREQETLIFSELTKIASRDNGLLIFCQGMTHGFVLYISRLLAFFLGTSYRQTGGLSSSTYPEIIVNMITTFFLTLLGSIVAFTFARRRHARGDERVLQRYGKTGLDAALTALQRNSATLEHYDLFTMALKANHNPRFWDLALPSHPSWARRRGLLSV